MIDLPFDALAFLVAYVAVTVITPRLLSSPTLLVRRPNLAIVLWLGSLAVSISFLWVGTGLIVSEWFRRRQSGVSLDDWASSVAGSILTWLSLAALGIIAFRLIASGQALAAERAKQIATVAPMLRRASSYEIDGNCVYIVDDAARILAAVPYVGAIVVSRNITESVDTALLRAAIEHERAHLVLRHSVLVSIARLAVSAAGGFTASQRFTQSIRIAIELVADDWAARRFSPATVADALEAVHPSNPEVTERVTRLRVDAQ